jgi:hypothetical protein
MFGAKGDGKLLNATVTVTSGAGPKTFTVSGGTFTTSDVGKVFICTGAGTAGATYQSIITAASGVSVTCSGAVGTSLTNSTQTVVYGTDDTTAIMAASLAASAAAPNTPNQQYGGGIQVQFLSTIYLTSKQRIRSNVHFVGPVSGPVNQAKFPACLDQGSPNTTLVDIDPDTSSIFIDCSGYYSSIITGHSGTAITGSNTQFQGFITIATGLSNVVGADITVTGNHLPRIITAYDSVTGIATVGYPWETVPVAGTAYSFPSHAVGDPYTCVQGLGQTSLQSNNPVPVNYDVCAGISNINLLSFNNHYLGFRAQGTAQGVFKDMLVFGFLVGCEKVSAPYCEFNNIVCNGKMIGRGYFNDDHGYNVRVASYGYAGLATITASNRYWMQDYQALIGFDPNGTYATGEYRILGAAPVNISCDSEGYTRTRFVSQDNGFVDIGCHHENWISIGDYYQSASGSIVGGDAVSTNSVPAIDGNNSTLTITGFNNASLPSSNPGVFMGTFSGSTQGVIKISNSPPWASDITPAAGSIIQWDAYPRTNVPLYCTATSVNNIGNTTLFATYIVPGQKAIVIRGGAQTGAINDPLDTAGDFFGRISHPFVGLTFDVTFFNTTGFTQLISPNTGMTLLGTGVTGGNYSLASNTKLTLTFVITNLVTPAISVYG